MDRQHTEVDKTPCYGKHKRDEVNAQATEEHLAATSASSDTVLRIKTETSECRIGLRNNGHPQ